MKKKQQIKELEERMNGIVEVVKDNCDRLNRIVLEQCTNKLSDSINDLNEGLCSGGIVTLTPVEIWEQEKCCHSLGENLDNIVINAMKRYAQQEVIKCLDPNIE